jgi:hypothetical protein
MAHCLVPLLIPFDRSRLFPLQLHQGPNALAPSLTNLDQGLLTIVATEQLGHCQHYVRTPVRTFVKLENALGKLLNAMYIISYL